MSLRVKKELERIYDGLLSVTVVCLGRVKKTGMAGAQAMAGVSHAQRRATRNAGGNGKRAVNVKSVNAKNVKVKNTIRKSPAAPFYKGGSNDRPSQATLTIFRRFFGFIPLSNQIAQPIHSLSTNRTEFDPATFHIESILDADARMGTQMGASMPFSARRRRLVWLRKTGLDAPCATVNLARDALDESLIFANAVVV